MRTAVEHLKISEGMVNVLLHLLYRANIEPVDSDGSELLFFEDALNAFDILAETLYTPYERPRTMFDAIWINSLKEDFTENKITDESLFKLYTTYYLNYTYINEQIAAITLNQGERPIDVDKIHDKFREGMKKC